MQKIKHSVKKTEFADQAMPCHTIILFFSCPTLVPRGRRSGTGLASAVEVEMVMVNSRVRT